MVRLVIGVVTAQFMEGSVMLLSVIASYLPHRIRLFLMRFFGPRVMIGERRR